MFIIYGFTYLKFETVIFCSVCILYDLCIDCSEVSSTENGF